ncbi:hypothetical protein LSTR_LSTR015251 [Laodelphax striatellus]|uniref:Uncharacterized protein n=1 Tax=Laodelphax striatellus TaxID=195883 RepID=A0A482XAV2_LAOST|nr:hypothetical protein LSTR_LSTR015251 [Laodelphax striatellus]
MTEKGPRWLKSVGGYSTDEQWMGVLFVEVISRDITGDYDRGGGKQVVREGNKERKREEGRKEGAVKGRRGEKEVMWKRGGEKERRRVTGGSFGGGIRTVKKKGPRQGTTWLLFRT